MGVLRSKLNWLWSQRKHPQKRVRLFWRVAFALVVALVLLSSSIRLFALWAWAIANCALLITSAAWGATNLRKVLKGVQTAFRWGFCLTFFAALILLEGFDKIVSLVTNQTIDLLIFNTIVLIMLVLIPLLLAALVALGVQGAFMIGYVYHHRPGEFTKERVGAAISSHWIVVLLLTFAAAAWHEAIAPLFPAQFPLLGGSLKGSDYLLSFLVAGTPWLSVGGYSLLHKYLVGTSSAHGKLWKAFSARLAIKRRIWGKERKLDMRGATLGGVAAGLTLLMSAVHLLASLQTATLAGYLRLRAGLPRPVPFHSSPVVILEMDFAARRRAMMQSSETALQAEAIRKLKGYGVKRIVLPRPLLSLADLTRGQRRGSLSPTVRDIFLAQRDVPILAKAMKEAGNVVLAADNAPSASEELPLRSAACAVIQARTPTYGAGRLPRIAATWTNNPPAPILLDAALKGVSPSYQAIGSRSDIETVNGATVPLVEKNTIVVDFESFLWRRKLPRQTYTDALSGEAMPDLFQAMDSDGVHEWTPPAEFYRDKVVFLDSLDTPEQETYIGIISCMEALARTTNSLSHHTLIQRFPTLAWMALTLLLGAGVGHIGLRRNPMDAGWYLLPLALVVIAYSFSVLVQHRVWFDPLVPVAAMLFAFALTTQMTYVLEKEGRERNRALLGHFVAPEVVEEYIDNMENLKLGGAKQSVCILFADVRNFTGFAESREPEEVVEVINEYMTALTDAMFQHGGLLDKYTGDGLMAFFRVAPPLKENVGRAVLAALAMQNASTRLSLQREAAGKPVLEVGISVHYGEAVVGLVGSATQSNYTAMGLTVVVGARLQSLAEGGEVIVSRQVYELISDTFSATSLEEVAVKGLSEPIHPYRLNLLATSELAKIPEDWREAERV